MAVIGYLTLAFLILIVELKRKRPLPFDFIFMFNLWFAGSYSIIPILILLFEPTIKDYFLSINYTFLFGNWYTPWLLIASYIIFLYGYYSVINNTLGKIYIKTLISENLIVYIITFSYVLLLLMVTAYCISNGGLTESITIGIHSRLTGAEAEISRFAFLKRIFVSLSPILLYFTFYKSIIRKYNYRYIYRFYFVIGLCAFAIIASINAGRGYIVFTVLGLYFLYCNYKRRILKMPLVLMGLLLLIFIVFGKPLIGIIPFLITGQYGSIESFLNVKHEALADRGILVELIRNAVHPINSFQISLSCTDRYNFRLLKDIVSAAIRLVPTSLLGIRDIPFNTVTFINSKIISPYADEGIPPGLMGGFVYTLYIPGLFLGSFLYGLIGRTIQNILINSLRISSTALVPHYLLMTSFGLFVFNGDISIFVPKNIMTCLLIVIILMSSKIFIARRKYIKI